jgi:hypothetical protein
MTVLAERGGGGRWMSQFKEQENAWSSVTILISLLVVYFVSQSDFVFKLNFAKNLNFIWPR